MSAGEVVFILLVLAFLAWRVRRIGRARLDR